MNIRVDLNTSIRDGMEVVFRSPVDCSQVTGLKVYYIGKDGSTAAQEFMLADAHGNNVGDINHLFAEDVVVKVILDVATGMAFVQNADTNAYLEGRFASMPMEVADKLCPTFTESGSVVTCEPVEGYPLGVVTHIQPVQEGSGDPSPDNIRPIAGHRAVKLTRCGKNLIPFPFRQLTGAYGGITWTVNDDATITLNGTASSNGTYFVLLEKAKTGIGIPVDGTYTMSCPGGSNSTYYLQPYVNGAFQTPVYGVSKTYNWTGTVDKLVLWVAPNAVLENVVVKPQIEVGNVATDFEPYQGNTFTVDLGQTVYGGSLDWKAGVLTVTHGNIESYTGEEVPEGWVSSTGDLSEGAQVVYSLATPVVVQLTPTEVLALAGPNYLYSNTGDTTVTGRADPAAVMEKLTNAIIALGGNV